MADKRLRSIKWPELPDRYFVKDYDADIAQIFEDVYNLYPRKSLPSAPIHSFADGADGIPIKAMEVAVRAVQDLHGQSAPYPAGGGKNKLGVTMTRLKTMNSGGTWSGNTYTYNGTTFVCTATSDDYLESVTVSASNATANVLFTLMAKTDVASKLSALENTAIIGSGCPADGNTSTYYLNFQGFATDGIGAPDTGSGTGTINASSFTTFNTVQIYIRVASGATFSNKVFKPQLCLASASNPTTFAPYSNICPIVGWDEAQIVGTGVNVWDEQWELGSIDTNGNDIPATNSIRSVGYTPILPSTVYYLHGSNVGFRFYDKDKNFLTYFSAGNVSDRPWTSPANAYYVRLAFLVAYGTTYGHDISINYPATDHDYHAYNGKIVTIDFGGTVYGGILRYKNGLVWGWTPLYADVDMGSLNWTTGSTSGAEYCMLTSDLSSVIKPSESNSVAGDLMCSVYANTSRNSTYAKTMGIAVNDSGSIYVYDPNYNGADSPASFKTAMTGQKIRYALLNTAEVDLTADGEVVTQYGDNVLFADCGDSELTYRQDIGLLLAE